MIPFRVYAATITPIPCLRPWFLSPVTWNDTGAIQLSIQRWVLELSLSLWSVLTTPSETYFRSGPMSYAIEWSHICEATRKEKRERETNKMEGLERKEETEREGGKMDPLQEMVSWETRGKPINAKMDASSSSFHSCILHSTRAFGVYTHPFLLCISLPPLRCSLYSSCS